MDNLSFRAQSLDNQAPDPIENNKCLLREDDVAERQDLIQKISEVSLNGVEVFSEDSHTALLHGNKFLLKTPSDQLDEAGRIAPILCYGRVPNKSPESWSSDVVNAMVGFAERIGRTVSEESQEIARRGTVAIEKKNKIHRMIWRVVAFLIIHQIVCRIYRVVEVTRKIMRLKRRRQKMLWLTGGLLIVLAVFGIIYKIVFRE